MTYISLYIFINKYIMTEDDWYSSLNKSKFTPPNYIFSIVWLFLYVFIFVAFFRYTFYYKNYISSILLFFCHILLNICWPIVFFHQHNIELSYVIIWLLWFIIIITMCAFFFNHDYLDFALFIPYFIWVSFGIYLNWYIYKYN